MKLPAVALTFALTALLGGPASAQDGQAADSATPQVSEAQIEAFLDIAIEVQRIQESAQQQIMAIMEAAEGMTLEEYQGMLNRMQAEPGLRDRIRTRAQERTAAAQ